MNISISAIAIALALAAPSRGLARDASAVPPGSIPVRAAPQFVSIGFDDNYFPHGMKWILDFLRDKKNPGPQRPNPATYDGAPVRVSFFVNTINAVDINAADSAHKGAADSLAAVYKQALADGHEIGNHTQTHNTWCDSGAACWKKEITSCWGDLAKRGIPKAVVTGFRTPYLSYGASTFAAIDSLHFRYDCSIESGFSDSADGTNFYWPYTLDKGVPPPDIIKGVAIGKHPGLWEIPAYCVIVPPDLRPAIAARNKKLDAAKGKIRGLDYDLWVKGTMEIAPDEYLRILKYNLDRRLAGNRAPLCFGAHTPLYDSLQFYAPDATDSLPSFTTIPAMRKAMEDFILYALSKPEVRIVPFREIVCWCEKPIALGDAAEKGPAGMGPAKRSKR